MAQVRLLEVARAVADETNRLLGNRQLRLIHRGQLRDSAQSIPANIREGWVENPDRTATMRIATHGDRPKKRTNISERTLRTVAFLLRSSGKFITGSLSS